ncbi:MAG: alcohol dehydrogenase catalytic domain-containing protein [Chloroflexi bacterium]|nr:alcohol dehydrogenase catalytic domain-containing protein [Chloroflexota bacterium]
MKTAYFYGGSDIRVVEEEIPKPGAGEVLFRVMSAGVCGSDLHNYRGHRTREGAPWQQGHELSGEIAAVGEGVDGLEVGMRVGIEAEHLLGCGTCRPCLDGQYHICLNRGIRHGVRQSSHGFSQYDVCVAENVVPLPDRVSFDAAALVDCYACGVHATNRVPDVDGQTVAIIGAGAIALTLGQVLKSRGAERVVLVGTRKHPVEVAVSAGSADVGVVSSESDPVRAVLAVSGGEGVGVTFETVGGQNQLIQQAVEMTRRGGVVSVLGLFTKPQTIDPALAMEKEVAIQWSNSFSSWNGRSEFGEALELLGAGKLNPEPIVTHHFGIDDIAKAFATADDKRSSGAIRVVVKPWE